MTPNQKKALDYIKQYWVEHGFSPSYRELDSVTHGGLGNTHKIVNDLYQKGFIHIDRRKQRAIYPMSVWYELRGQIDGGNKAQGQAEAEEPQEKTGA